VASCLDATRHNSIKSRQQRGAAHINSKAVRAAGKGYKRALDNYCYKTVDCKQKAARCCSMAETKASMVTDGFISFAS